MEVGPSLGCLMGGHLLPPSRSSPSLCLGLQCLVPPLFWEGLETSALRHPDSAASWWSVLPLLFPSWTALPLGSSQGGSPLHPTLLCVPCWELSTPFVAPPEGLTTVPAPSRGQDPLGGGKEAQEGSSGPRSERVAELDMLPAILGPAAQQVAPFPAL